MVAGGAQGGLCSRSESPFLPHLDVVSDELDHNVGLGACQALKNLPDLWIFSLQVKYLWMSKWRLKLPEGLVDPQHLVLGVPNLNL